MRRSGRTTRIVDFAIDQILTSGSVVVADHYSLQKMVGSFRTSNDSLIKMIMQKWEENHKDNFNWVRLDYDRIPINKDTEFGDRLPEVIRFYLRPIPLKGLEQKNEQ
jgi:hypothetical protein